MLQAVTSYQRREAKVTRSQQFCEVYTYRYFVLHLYTCLQQIERVYDTSGKKSCIVFLNLQKDPEDNRQASMSAQFLSQTCSVTDYTD